MQNNIEEMSDFIIDQMCDYFDDRIDDYEVSDSEDDVDSDSFSIEFIAYEYFPVVFHYEKGKIGYSIAFEDRMIPLNSSQKLWEKADFNILFKEIQEDLELRIPDKFLKARGWL